MKTIFSILLSLTLLFSVKMLPASDVSRVILFMIDGMNWKAPDTLNMPVFNSLIKDGTYIQKSYMIIPHHPTIGDYSNFNSCSFPNPMLHEGTVFIRPENRMIQEMISPGRQTAFIVNTSDYYTVATGFTTCIMDPSLSDRQVVEQAISLLEKQSIAFMRVHLQTAGNLGLSVFMSSPDEPYHRDIWGRNSPYSDAIENADKLLGEFIAYLKKSGKWDNTILIVTADHGQSQVGWHPLFDEESWSTPLVFHGPGIAKGRELPYFEHTDLAPTIAWLLGVEHPNPGGGGGNPVKEIMANSDVSRYIPEIRILKINQQIKEFNLLKSELLLMAEKKRYLSNVIAALENTNLTKEPFYHQDRITDWHKAGSAEHMIEANENILKMMRGALNQ